MESDVNRNSTSDFRNYRTNASGLTWDTLHGMVVPEDRSVEFDPTVPTSGNPRVSDYRPYYYCGGQAQVFFDDVLIDEIGMLQFNVVTNKQPIYGYASQLFDTVAAGNMIIQGAFTINFVEANYLPVIATHLQDTAATRLPHHSKPGSSPAIGSYGTGVDLIIEGHVNPDSFQGKQILNNISGLGNEDFRALSKRLKEEQGLEGVAPLLDRFDKVKPFDIWAMFGDYTDSTAPSTARKISNVHLTSMGSTIMANGEPIQEVYNFVARDIT